MTGCISVNSYVDPGHSQVGQQEIHRRATPLPVSLQVTFTRNGTAVPENDDHVRQLVADTLHTTGVLEAVPAAQAQASLKVVVDNQYNGEHSVGQGVLAGLTFGAIGKTVIDQYHFTFTLVGPHQPLRRGTYDHAIQTTLGHSDAPVQARARSTNQAFEIVVQQSVLNFLADVQAAGDGPLPIGFIHHD